MTPSAITRRTNFRTTGHTRSISCCRINCSKACGLVVALPPRFGQRMGQRPALMKPRHRPAPPRNRPSLPDLRACSCRGSTCSSFSIPKACRWKYYLARGAGAGLRRRRDDLRAATQQPSVPSIWNPRTVFRLGESEWRAYLQATIRRQPVPGRHAERHTAASLLGGAVRHHQRASAQRADRRHGVRHLAGQRGDAIALLAEHRDLHHLGRLGRVLRSCRPAQCRYQRHELIRIQGFGTAGARH